MIFKNLFVYYLAIVIPMIALYLLGRSGMIDSTFLVIALLTYMFVYHPLVSGLRLVSMGRIPRSKFFHNFIPGWNTQYFSSLFFARPLE